MDEGYGCEETPERPVSYLINDGVRERTVHIDHLLLSHEEVADCSTSSYGTHKTSGLELPQPNSSIPEADGRISNPVPAQSQSEPTTSPVRLSSMPCPGSPPQYGNTPVEPAEPVAGPAATQIPGRRYPARLRVAPKRLNL